MTHDIETELNDEQLADVVGGTSGYIRVMKLNSGLVAQDDADLVKVGTGTLVLSGANTYDGTTQSRQTGIIAI